MKRLGQVVEITSVLLLWCNEAGVNGDPGQLSDEYETRTPKGRTYNTLSYEDYLKEKRARLLYFEYYPNYGYEPYWADGEHVLTTLKTTRGPTTLKQSVCGEPCTFLLRRIKHVCARKSNYYWLHPESGCGVSWWYWIGSKHCRAKSGPNFDHAYFNFDTYCDFLDAQCVTKFHSKTGRWTLINIGKCKILDTYYKPMWDTNQPVSRAKFYLSSLNPPTK